MRGTLLFALVFSTVAQAAAPSEGVALKVRRGFFTETDIGGFMTVGGNDQYSNLQTYLQLGIGYDVGRNVEFGLHYGTGANAADCYNGKTSGGDCSASDNFNCSPGHSKRMPGAGSGKSSSLHQHL